MDKNRIHMLGIGGTLRPGSLSLRALEHALEGAREAGASVQLISVRELDLPMFVPGVSEQELAEPVQAYLQQVRTAQGLLISTGAYHGTMAGVTKNALDYLEYLSKDDPPYLQDRVVGLIATAGGEMAAVRSLDAMAHVIHALRGTVAPLQVAVPQSWKALRDPDRFESSKWAGRLDQLGQLVVDMARRYTLPLAAVDSDEMVRT